MTFIRQHFCDFIERVRVRRILAQRHQEDRILLSYSIVHPLLQRSFLFSNNVVVADDVVDFHGAGRSLRIPRRIRQEFASEAIGQYQRFARSRGVYLLSRLAAL
jgi:hypothetical protein